MLLKKQPFYGKYAVNMDFNGGNKMIKATLAYIPMGIGSWNEVTVSREIALALAAEYASFGWPVKVNNEDFLHLKSAA
jgi:hypothetical protein